MSVIDLIKSDFSRFLPQKHNKKKQPPHLAGDDEKNIIITADDSCDTLPAYEVKHSEIFGRFGNDLIAPVICPAHRHFTDT